MSHVPATMTMDHSRLNFLEKLLTLGMWVVAGWLFLSIGWAALAPDDPQAAVSLFARRSVLTMVLTAAGLAGVTAGLATVVGNRLLVDVGTFAACVGLIAASTRGGTSTYFILSEGQDSAMTSARVARSFLLEAMVWSLVVPVLLLVSGILSRRWVEGGSIRHALSAYQDMVGRGLPDASFTRTNRSAGLKHVAWTAGASLLAWFVLSADPFSRSVQHGQAIFVAAAAVCLGSYVAHRAAPVHSAAWSVMGALLATWVGYACAMFATASATLPTAIPASRFLRVLPIQSVFAGVAAAILMGWYYVVVSGASEVKRTTASPPTARQPR
ncbi:MAG: hypothetical protein AABZ47_16920 [Planctomycetota bacterium]